MVDDITLIEVFTITILGTLGLVASGSGILVLLQSTITTGIVRHYCLCIVSCASIVIASHLFWGVPRAIWSDRLNISTIDNLFGLAICVATSVIYVAKISLAFNRFVAIAFNGRYYSYMKRARNWQYILLIGYPLISVTPMIFPGYRVYWIADGLNSFTIENGAFAQLYLEITQTLGGWSVIVICTSLDTITFSLVRWMRRKYQSTEWHPERSRMQKEYIIISQMMFNNFGMILSSVCVTLTTLLLTEPPNLVLFFCWTGAWLIASGMEGLWCTIFFRDKMASNGRSGTVSTINP